MTVSIRVMDRSQGTRTVREATTPLPMRSGLKEDDDPSCASSTTGHQEMARWKRRSTLLRHWHQYIDEVGGPDRPDDAGLGFLGEFKGDFRGIQCGKDLHEVVRVEDDFHFLRLSGDLGADRHLTATHVFCVGFDQERPLRFRLLANASPEREVRAVCIIASEEAR